MTKQVLDACIFGSCVRVVKNDIPTKTIKLNCMYFSKVLYAEVQTVIKVRYAEAQTVIKVRYAEAQTIIKYGTPNLRSALI